MTVRGERALSDLEPRPRYGRLPCPLPRMALSFTVEQLAVLLGVEDDGDAWMTRPVAEELLDDWMLELAAVTLDVRTSFLVRSGEQRLAGAPQLTLWLNRDRAGPLRPPSPASALPVQDQARKLLDSVRCHVATSMGAVPAPTAQRGTAHLRSDSGHGQRPCPRHDPKVLPRVRSVMPFFLGAGSV